MEMKHGDPAAWILCAGLSCLLLSGCAARPGSGGSSAEERQCASGDGEACMMWGDKLMESSRSEQDLKMASEYYRRGCQLKNNIACIKQNMFDYHLSVSGLIDYLDDERYERLMRRGCEQDMADDCLTLAGMYYTGRECRGTSSKP